MCQQGISRNEVKKINDIEKYLKTNIDDSTK
jgi:hypothetical protein